MHNVTARPTGFFFPPNVSIFTTSRTPNTEMCVPYLAVICQIGKDLGI
jgi:hypothetical protein